MGLGKFVKKVGNFFTGTPQRSSSGPVEIPGIIGRDEAAGYLRQATNQSWVPRNQGLLDSLIKDPYQRAASPYTNLASSINNPAANPYSDSLQNATLNPAANPYSSSLLSGTLNPAANPYNMNLANAINNPAANPYNDRLQSAILNPTFGASNPAEQAMIDSIMASRQGTFNALGTGASPGTQSAISAAAAPTLLDLYQRNIGNLQSGSDLYNTQARGNIADLLSGSNLSDIQRRGNLADIRSGSDLYNAQAQQNVQNLQTGSNIFNTQQRGRTADLLSGEGQFQTTENMNQQAHQDQINSVLASLGQELQKRGIDMKALLTAAGMGVPQVGQQTSEQGAQRGFLDFFNQTFGSGGAFGGGGAFGSGGKKG